MKTVPAIRSQPHVRLAGLLALGLSLGAHGQLPIPFNNNGESQADRAGMLPMSDMLIDGSVLEHVILPKYDTNRRLSSSLTADKLVLVDSETLEGEGVVIRKFRPDGATAATVTLRDARLRDNFVRSDSPVHIVAGDLTADGTGAVWQLPNGAGNRGMLLGPATARMLVARDKKPPSKDTSMIPRHPALAAAGALMLVSTAPAEETSDRLGATEMQGLDRLAVSSEPEIAGRKAEEAKEIAEDDARIASAGATLDDFLKEAAVTLPDGPKPDLSADVPAPDTSAMKDPATVSAKDGIFVDADKGVMVLLNQVEFDHPQFTLTGADEVKVFFAKDPEPASDAKEDGDGFDFGDPSKITATGQLVLEKKILAAGDKKAKASGRQMIYDVPNETIIIRGGRPWIISDSASGYVTDPNGYIRINVATGDASFVGDSKGFIQTDKVGN